MQATKTVILDVMAWAAAHLDEDLSVEILARRAGYSTPYFARAFAAVVGEGPAGWVLGQRVERAAERLADGGARVLDVALDCGFNDVTTFERAFRRRTGLTPSAFRRVLSDAERQRAPVTTGERVMMEGFRLSGLAVDVAADPAAPAALWQRLSRLIGEMGWQIAPDSYRQVAFWQGDPAQKFTCIAGFIDTEGMSRPLPFVSVDVPGTLCRRFVVAGVGESIASAYDAIYSDLMPGLNDWPAGNFVCEVPRRDGMDGVEIWVPVKPALDARSA